MSLKRTDAERRVQRIWLPISCNSLYVISGRPKLPEPIWLIAQWTNDGGVVKEDPPISCHPAHVWGIYRLRKYFHDEILKVKKRQLIEIQNVNQLKSSVIEIYLTFV